MKTDATQTLPHLPKVSETAYCVVLSYNTRYHYCGKLHTRTTPAQKHLIYKTNFSCSLHLSYNSHRKFQFACWNSYHNCKTFAVTTQQCSFHGFYFKYVRSRIGKLAMFKTHWNVPLIHIEVKFVILWLTWNGCRKDSASWETDGFISRVPWRLGLPYF